SRGQLVLEQLTQRSDAARGRLLHHARITADDLAAARTTLRPLLQSLATSDRNARPGIPATGAELPVNDLVVLRRGTRVDRRQGRPGGCIWTSRALSAPLWPGGTGLRR